MTRFDGKLCAFRTVHLESFDRDDKVCLYVGPESKLPVGGYMDFGRRVVFDRYKDVKLNVSIDPQAFVWTPSTGATERKLERR